MMQNIRTSSNGVNVNNLGSARMNGNNTNVFLQSTGQQSTTDNFIFQSVDPSLEDDDSDSDTAPSFHSASPHDFLQSTTNSGLKPGKKTKGRVKIKMEFIENKLRRYTTFSKRKTGIMKKAYELSTLTGTQVMLLVASETGHVYTFATRKLQPMITSESGKALIQTCLNSPDPPPGTQSGNSLEQRMNPSGYEETELSCSVEQEEQKAPDPLLKPIFSIAPQMVPVQQKQEVVSEPSPLPRETVPSSTSIPIVTTQVPNFLFQTKEQQAVSKIITTTTQSSNNSNNNRSTNNSPASTLSSSIPTLQIPLLLSQGTAISMFNPSGQHVGQAISVPQTSQSSQSVVKPPALSHVVSSLNSLSSSQTNNSGELNTPLPVSTPAALNIMPSMTPGIVMYHTPQGVVYATPTHNIQDRTIFNFPQPATAISMTPNDQNSGQQIITIPVPVSVATNSTIQLAAPPASDNSKSGDTGQMKHSPSKKLKK